MSTALRAIFIICFTVETAIVAAAAGANPQQPRNPATKPTLDEGDVRVTPRHMSCRFAPVYARIKENKTDPRVAFIELSPLVHKDTSYKFAELCDMISDQSADTRAVFDAARGFLHIVWGEESINESLAYFAGEARRPGVFLYVKHDAGDFSNFVFSYREGRWRDESESYLASLGLTQHDYVVTPQYGRTVRVLKYDESARRFDQKTWLRWNGVKFEPVTGKPKDWRCPDSYRFFPASERRQYCE